MQEGLSQLSVMAIYQDQLGRMWFGTEEGISISTGVQTIVYKPSEYHRENTNPIGNQTHFIAGDKDGNVFFDSDNALIRYDIRTQKFSCLQESNVNCITSIQCKLIKGSKNICVIIVDNFICSFDAITDFPAHITTI